MSTFGRKFADKKITPKILEENPWFRDILLYWRPAGDALQGSQKPKDEATRLRLAIRNGYLNFYRGGQSVARIDFARNGLLQAHIHNKYVYGCEDSGQDDVTVTCAGIPDRQTGGLREYRGAADMRDWIANANKHVGKEKHFLDSITAHNADTIDVEMGLPAYSLDPEKRTAPRIDLVALEPVDSNYRIVFWEAKLVGDARARRGDDVLPEVVDQLKQYTTWLKHGENRELVTSAYQETCRLLVAFHELAKSVNPNIEHLGQGIVAAAAEGAPPLLIDDHPRLLIDDRSENLAFTKNGHLDKLRKSGLHVQMVQSGGQMVLGSGV